MTRTSPEDPPAADLRAVGQRVTFLGRARGMRQLSHMDPPAEKRDPASSEGTRPRPDMIGRVLSDRYRIDALVASGSFGSVYRGAHLHMHKQVAIKILHPEVENFPDLVERFEREAVAGAHISHPNVAVASDLGKFDGDSYFLVMEYVPGVTLREVMKSGPMPAERAAFIARQIAEALGAAHQHKIIHRDLKPSNIMIVDGTNDMVKLIDFGFARVPIEELPQVPQGDQGPEWQMSQAGVVFGSVSYMAPDAFLGMQNVDERSDLYALGLIFYEMLAGQHPFDVTLPPAALFQLQRTERPPPLREKNPDCDASDDLEWVIMRLLAKAPEERYQDASSVVAAIDGAMQGIHAFLKRREAHVSPTAPAPPSDVIVVKYARPARRETRSPRGLPSWWPGAAIGLVAIVAALVVLGRQLARDPPRTGSAPASATSVASPAAVAEPPPPKLVASASAAPKAPPDRRREFLSVADRAPSEAAAAWLRFISPEPQALRDPEVQQKTVALLTRADPDKDATGEVFEKLAHGAAEPGLDVLYRVVEEQPASKAAQRAAPLLYRQAATGGRMSAALRVTLDLRRMNCARKIQELGRAAKEGDQRTLRELDKLHPPGCVLRKGACCFKDDPKLESSLAQIRERTSR